MVSELRQGRKITKEQVLREMRTKAEDPDEIVATSSVLSLKDPVAYTRIVTPCRSIGCAHNQCFDAASYLQLQEQAPTWICPICNKAAPWEHLALDQYVDDILRSTPRDAEGVVVQPDGQWLQQDSARSNPNSNPTPSDDDDDDDDEIVEILDKAEVKPKIEALTPHSVRTPLSSREDSNAPSSRPHKRSRNDVIDLTLSDDEETPPAKVPKSSEPLSAPPRVRPPAARYQFHLPPPGSASASYNLERFNPSF